MTPIDLSSGKRSSKRNNLVIYLDIFRRFLLVKFGCWLTIRRQKKPKFWYLGFVIKSLAIPYFRMANCHTIIGAKRFHFRVRDGIGWFTLAMVTKQTGVKQAKDQRRKVFSQSCSCSSFCFFCFGPRASAFNSSQARSGFGFFSSLAFRLLMEICNLC